MQKIQNLLLLLDFAECTLTNVVARHGLQQEQTYYNHMLNVYRTVSLAEKGSQVKNACSPYSSRNDSNLINLL